MLIHNATLITWEEPNQLRTDQAILMEDGRIAYSGDSREMLAKHTDVETLDAQSQLLMPGNICAHTHFYGAFARGMAVPGRAPSDFPDILEKLWWPLDKSLDREAVEYSALVCLIDAIRHGTTTLIDHHASPNFIDGSLDVLADAVDRAGLRAVLCYEVTDRDGPQKAQAGIDENVRFISRCRTKDFADGRVTGMFGLHASLTLSEGTLERCRSAAPEGSGFHIHVAEHEVDEYDSLAKTGERVVDRLHRHGLLGQHSIVVHAVHVDAAEIQLLAETGTWVTHQPRSNMNNGVGLGDVEAMLRMGVRVCLGNDGFSNAMWEEWKTAYLAHKLWNRDPRRMPGEIVARMGTYNNAALASMLLGTELGVIRSGAAADVILVDYHPTTPMTAGNLPWHILFGFHESMITTTIVDGKILMKDRQLMNLDEAEITAKARQLANESWKRYQKLVPADEAGVNKERG